MLSDHDFLRYSRQIMLPLCGELGIKTLAKARVVVIGAGGLATVVAPYLVGAGVGYLRLCDDDIVSVSNLPRQWLYSPAHIGQQKVRVMAAQLKALQPAAQVEAIPEYADNSNLSRLMSDADLVLDCSDNMTTRQLVNAYAMDAGVALVSAAAIGLHAQAAAFQPGLCGPHGNHGCYRCLYPIDSQRAGNCQSEGVLGPMVGMAGCYQAALALRILLGDPNVPWSQLWRLDSTLGEHQLLRIQPDPSCSVCGHVSHSNASSDDSSIPNSGVLNANSN
ncbi:MAG: HesA/MoeB/ThiF family protein [Firmicutes bacterium]|nr:HesA/MoeB/ThiF family protein [Bacillota bacterium]